MSVGAYLLINVDTGKEEEVLKALRKIEGIKNVHIVTGLHDLICYIEADDLKKIKKIITKEIRGIKGIQKTITCMSLDLE
uniref:Lrp/AsnC family transcriptional regulator n=1 Tax=candidate division WOR-3 bacterium TaxID=2052148 RepID=A0A7C4UHB9_UNCW3